MANDLTGDFDLVAQFSKPAVDRLLAAMHGIKRFPHSLSLRIDDRPPKPGHQVPISATEIIDTAGDSVVDPIRITDAGPIVAVGDPRFDGIVNPHSFDLELQPLEPSLLHGRAQLQLAPPTIEIMDAATSTIRVRIPVRARYIADPHTPPVAEFAMGHLFVTTSVSQITSQVGRVVDIDLRGPNVQAMFEPTWSSAPIASQDRAAVNRLIRNTLRSSTLPSNTTLPSGIETMMFKAFTAPAPAVAALINLSTAGGNPATAHRVFLNTADFAFGVGIDALRAAFQPALDEILSTPIPKFEVSITGPNPTYTVKLNSAEMDLRPGKILLVIKGRATTGAWYAPNFNFTVTQAFTLQPNGTTADLVIGSLSLDTSSWIVNRFRGTALDKFRPIRDRALAQSDAIGKVRRLLDTERMLGGFLRSLLTPARPENEPQPPALGATLSYTSTDIETSGLILRGVLTLADWGPAHVEFQEITPVSNSPLSEVTPVGKEYSAFKSWIAGGVIDSFEWKRAFTTSPGFRDEHRFVKLPQQPGVEVADAFDATSPGHLFGYQPMCLTITGRRMTAAGPIAQQPVTASYCAFHWFPLVDVSAVDQSSSLMVALTRPAANGLVEVVGHAPAARRDKARAVPNLFVQFGDAESAARLQPVVDIVRKVGRADAPTAVVAILDPDSLARARHVDGVIYVESDPRWAKGWALDIERRPLTAVIDASGNAVWQHPGDLDPSVLADVLRRMLKPSRFPGVSTVSPGVRVGHLPPNFVFTYERGHELTLRKLAGRPVMLMFTRSADACDHAATHAGWERAAILNIVDASAGDRATQQASAANTAVTIVHDLDRAISKAYGIAAWPTIIYIDARGRVRDVEHGDLHLAGARG